MNTKELEQHEQKMFEINRRVAKALGYTVVSEDNRTYDEEGQNGAAWAVIVDPNGVRLQITERETEDPEETLKDAIEWAWEELCHPENREYLTEEEIEELPPLWSMDEKAALGLLDSTPTEYEISLKSNRGFKPGNTLWHCFMDHPEDKKCAASGLHDTVSIAVCEAWLQLKAIEWFEQQN